jgi:hypothetical protein
MAAVAPPSYSHEEVVMDIGNIIAIIALVALAWFVLRPENRGRP